MDKKIHAVTGAFGYSGKYIAQRLLEQDKQVITLTGHQGKPSPFGDRVKAFPFNFDQPDELAKTLEGVSVLYNTFWIRFNDATAKEHSTAYKNTLTLFKSARTAGVERIVHISITNPSTDSDIPYFREKAELENLLQKTGIPHSILRPAILFGKEDILINNIAWALRKLPVFGIFGDGKYPIQPIHVDDLAELAVAHGEGKDNAILNAVGPERFVYRDLIEEIADAIGKKRILLPVPPTMGYLATLAISELVGDLMMTRDEIKALMRGLLAVDAPPTGKTKLSEWMRENADTIGKKYASEQNRRK